MNIKNKLIYFLGGIPFAEHYNALQRNKQRDYKRGHDDTIIALRNLINDISGCDSQTWIDTVYNAIQQDKIITVTVKDIRTKVINNLLEQVIKAIDKNKNESLKTKYNAVLDILTEYK